MNYEPLYTFAEKHRVPYNELCTALRAALAAPQPEPVAEVIDREHQPWEHGKHTSWLVNPSDLPAGTKLYAAAPPAAPAPGDMVMVPLKFVQDFNTLAHNYCLRAVPPDYYSGTEADAFQHAYSRCGSDLRRLREILAAAPAPADWGDQLQQEVDPVKWKFGPAPAHAVPDGMALVPDYRGYAALGTGQYILDISADANPAELIIHVATDAEKEGRTVGDLRDKGGPGEPIPPEKMAVRLAFITVAGLDALEQQLRILRETHFAVSAAPAVREPLTDAQIDKIFDDAHENMPKGELFRTFVTRAIERAHGIGGGGNHG